MMQTKNTPTAMQAPLMTPTSAPTTKLVGAFNLPPAITTKQAEDLGIGSNRQVRRWCADGTIKAVRIGQHWRINRDALLEQFGLLAGSDGEGASRE